MRTTILTHYFPPEAGAPQVRLHALARGLAGAGHDVTVHTCPPHYPGGAIAAGHRNAIRPRRARDDGFEVVRSMVLPAANAGRARRLLDHASFAASALATAHAAGPADVVVAETPPLFLAAVAPSYARRVGGRLVLHVADLWPDSAIELGMVTDARAIAAARALERHAYRRSVRIVAPTEGLVERLERHPDARGKVVRIPPAVDCERFAAPAPSRAGPLRVLYAGTVGMAQGVATLVEAAGRLGPDQVRVTIAGDGAELAAVRAAAAGLDNVSVLGSVDAAAIPGLYARTDVAAVLLRDRPLFDGALPSKTFEALAAGRPVLLAARGEAAALIEGARAGVVVAPEDRDALAGALAALAALPQEELRATGARARACAERFDRSAMLARWSELLAELG